ncbi:hypothetical protein [Clostridium sp. MD294]|uniref:hypothetical protein n=1 Tax=Clostridium sp. MD294 TaxID=97138 RepID=UPI0002C9FBD7|nr:hypothetical protein [Clostridium sp. MD294]NDO47779.1 hypothetical protein [Clostridium sp. MD294]USF29903.1 hypothetical protein C820_001323 [Clostridium sp. MD294]
MLQKATKFLKWGQMGIAYVPKAKSIFSITKRFLPKKKKKIKKVKKSNIKAIFRNIKKGFSIIKEYCYYMKRIFVILKER